MSWLLLLAPLLTTQVHGANSLDTIIIDRGVDEPIRIAVVPFAVNAATAADAAKLRDLANPADIVAFDLARSGQFDPMAKENMLSYPSDRSGVFFRDGHLKTITVMAGKCRRRKQLTMALSCTMWRTASAAVS